MQEILNMREKADILVAEKLHRIFTNRNPMCMNSVFNLDNIQIIVDITTTLGQMDCIQFTSLELLL